ncbi:hypothetical protein HK103_006833 [Boothiomyces macroporosus]|uniref:Uncharacterized protein n=2 Tax=Boothiomyces macroporosus TaxID=261099 RepID=A0AAD5UCV6_9FUNG|nr:hypothetical protein HK103_006833 [Boothiomyces macroporosus]
MKKWEFVALHFFVVFNLILAVILPVFYFSIFPNFLQYHIDQIGVNGNTIRIHKAYVGQMQNGSVPVEVDIRVDAFTSFPLQGGFLPNTVDISSGGKSLASLEVPELNFMLNEEIRVNVNSTLTLSADQQQNMQQLLKQLSSPDGVKDLQINIRLNPTVTTHGITIYPHLALKRDLSLGDVVASTKMLTGGPSNFKNPFIFFGPDSSLLSSELRSQFNADDIMQLPDSLGDFQLIWTKFALQMQDIMASTDFGFGFANPKYVSLANIDSISYYLAVENTRVLKMTIRNVGLKTEINSDFKIGFDFAFIDPSIDPAAVQTAIETAFSNFANKGDFGFALQGPVVVSGAGFFETITADLNVHGSIGDILSLVPKGYADILTNPTSAISINATQIVDIIGKSKIELDVLADKIFTSLGLNIPLFNFLKPPQQIVIPYQAGVSIYAGANLDQKVIDTSLAPISITRESGDVFVSTNATVVPQNSDDAANALAVSINPILAANPSVGQIGIKDLVFMAPGQAPFKWTQQLFGQRVLKIALPVLDKALINSLNSPALSNALGKVAQLAVGSVNVNQLTTQPGFAATGNVKVTLSPTLPTVHVDIGYFHIDTAIESVPLASLELPQGLQFFPSSAGTNINAQLVLGRDPGISAKAQSLVDALLKNGSPPSYFGTTGLKFGASAQNYFKTFSKVVVDINTQTLLDVLAGQQLNIAIPAGLVKVNSADVQLKSSTSLSLAAGTTLNLPFPFTVSASLGSVALTTTLEQQFLMGLNLGALNVGSGSKPADLQASVTLATGANGFAAKVGSAVNAILNLDASSPLALGATGLQLGSGAGLIDQFKNVTVSTTTGTVVALLKKLVAANGNAGSPLDLSAVLPADLGNVLATQVNPSVNSLKLHVLPQSNIDAGADLTYNNPIPVSASLPYVSLSALLDGNKAVDLALSNVVLKRNNGAMNPDVGITLANGLAAKVDSLLTAFMNGELSSKVGVQSLYFGASASDKNDLLSQVSLPNLNALLAPVVKVAGPAVASLVKKTGATVSKRDAAPFVIKGPMGISLALSGAGLELLDGQKVNANINAQVNLPAPFSKTSFDISIPYMGGSAFLEQLPVSDFSLGLNVQGQNPTVALNTLLALKDSDALADQVNTLVNAVLSGSPVPGNAIVKGLTIGASAQDTNDALSALTAALPLQNLIPSGLSGALDINALLAQLSPSISNIGVATKPGKVIENTAAIKFNLPFPVTLKGLNYFTASAALDGNALVDISSTSPISIASGTNELNAALDVHFPSSSGIQGAVSKFVNDLLTNINNNFTTPFTQKVSATNVAVGFSASQPLKALSKIVLNIDPNVLLNQKNFNAVLSLVNSQIQAGGSGLLSKAFLKRFMTHADQGPIINGEIIGGLHQLLPITANIGYAKLNAQLDGADLLEFGLNKALTLAADGGDFVASIYNYLKLSSDPAMEKAVATFFDLVLTKQPVPNSIGGTGAVFGASASAADVIDTFQTVNLSFKMQPIVNMIYKLVDNLLKPADPNTPSIFKGIKIVPKSMDLDVADAKTLVANAEIDLQGVPVDLDINIPYATAGLSYNGVSLVQNALQNIVVKDNKVTASVLLGFNDQSEAQPIYQDILTIVGNVAFNITTNTNDYVNLGWLAFGPSKDSQMTLLRSVNAKVELNPLVDLARKFAEPYSLENIDASIQVEGIHAIATLPDLGLPLNVKATLKSVAKWDIGKQRDPSKFVPIGLVVGQPFTLPHIDLLVEVPTLNPHPPYDAQTTAVLAAMTDLMVNVASFKSFAEGAVIGFVSLIGTNGVEFDILSKAYIFGPAGISLHNTLELDLVNDQYSHFWDDTNLYPLYDPTASQGPATAFTDNPVIGQISVINNSPLHLDAGQVTIWAGVPYNTQTWGKIDNSIASSMYFTSIGNVVLLNKNEGGNVLSDAGMPTVGLFNGNLWALPYFFSLDPVTQNIVAFSADKWDALLTAFGQSSLPPGILYSTIIEIKRDGKPVSWFNNLIVAMDHTFWYNHLYNQLADGEIPSHFNYGNYFNRNISQGLTTWDYQWAITK